MELLDFLKGRTKAEKALNQEEELKQVWQAVSHGRYEDALALVEKLVAGPSKTNRDVWMAKGSILEILKRPGEARESYEKAAVLGSKDGAKRAGELRAS